MPYPQTAEKLTIPPALLKWWRRVEALERGKVYQITLVIPEQKEQELQWAVTGVAKIER